MKNRSVIEELSRQCGEVLHEEWDDALTEADALTDVKDYLQSYVDRIDEFIGEIDDDGFLLSRTYPFDVLARSGRDDLSYYFSDVSEALIRLGNQVEQKIKEVEGMLNDAG